MLTKIIKTKFGMVDIGQTCWLPKSASPLAKVRETIVVEVLTNREFYMSPNEVVQARRK